MKVQVTAQDILEAVGVPFASTTEEAWADKSAAAATAYVNGLPITRSTMVVDEADVQYAAVMLAKNLYLRPHGGTTDFEGGVMSVTPALDSTISRLLRVGSFQRPVVA